ncbi:ATP-binding protein [Streptomyces sp. 4N509B]|uniref:ATP-binding protein n=1 Tax=Streptomyces sp. 4N509B TaxID=3457413 RepID=UPI003FD1C608
MTLTTAATSPTRQPDLEYAVTLPRAARNVGIARAVLRHALSDWDLDDLADAAMLVASELVTNAVQHTTGASITVTVIRRDQDTVRVAVDDSSLTRPVPRKPTAADTCWRGLLLVEALAVRWGTDRTAVGKRVWAELNRGAG